MRSVLVKVCSMQKNYEAAAMKYQRNRTAFDASIVK